MHLSRTVEYALRAVTYLASVPEGQYATAVDVSQTAGVPVDYLSKILRRMVQKGFLLSRKGHGGGFGLVRPLSGTTILDVLDAVDYSLDEQRCLWGWTTCGTDQPCPLHESWLEVKKAFLNWAKRTTLADLRVDRQRLRRRAGAEPLPDSEEGTRPEEGPASTGEGPGSERPHPTPETQGTPG